MVVTDHSFDDISSNRDAARHLIYCISFELLAVCVLVLYLYMFSSLYLLTGVITLASFIVLFNLYLVNRNQNIILCGHILSATLFLTVLIANYLVRGINPLFSIWFYVIPVVSIALTGRVGLIIYSSISLIVIISCRLISLPPYYPLSIDEISIIGWVNHFLAFIVIVNTLNSISKMGYQSEKSLKIEKKKYLHLARFDALTDLPNRHYFLLMLKKAMATLTEEQCITLFFMDLDNLKTINDIEGHHVGDYLLQETARRLSTCFRKEDFIARLSGDEFTAYVVHGRNRDIVKEIAQRIELAFQQDFQFKEQFFSSSISIGWATYPEEANTMDALLAAADTNMYKTKKIKKEDLQSPPDPRLSK